MASATGPVLTVEHFGPDALAEISEAGCVVAATIADIAHHHIGDPGFWDCYGSAPDELARLRAVLDQLAGAVRTARSQLASVERRARCRANAAGRRIQVGKHEHEQGREARP